MLLTLAALLFSLQTVTPHAGLAAPSRSDSSPTATSQTVTAVPAQTSAATAAASTGTPLPSTPIPEASFPHHYVVLIVIDAARPVDLTAWKLPHIQDLMKRGVVYDRAWVGELQSSTPNVHVTVGTGTLPRENGFLGFGWAAPDTRKQIDFRTLLANGAIEPVLRRLPVPSVAARLHQYEPNAISIAASGHKDYAVVGLGGGSATYEIYGRFNKTSFAPTFLPGHTPPHLTAAERKQLTLPSKLPLGAEDKWAFDYASIVARHVKPRLLMMNLPEMDTWGHWKGPNDVATVHALMNNIDRGIGRLEDVYRQLKILNQTDFIITADHAMMESKPAKNWHSLWVAADAVKAQVVRGDGEGGAVWLKDPTQAKAVADTLVRMKPGHVLAIFYRSAPGNNYEYLQASPKSWLINPGVAATLKHLVDTTAGQNGPDMWVLYRENYTVVPRNVQGTWKGTHGGTTWNVQHIPLVMSGPGIKSGIHSQFAARIVDIAPTMERLLGLPGMHRDGVTLADALLQPTRAETRAQSDIAPLVDGDAHVIQQQSAYDSSGAAHWPAIPVPPYRCGPKAPPGRTCQTTPRTATNS